MDYHPHLAKFVCPMLAGAMTFSGMVPYEHNEEAMIENCFQRPVADDLKAVIVAHPDYARFYPLFNCAYVVDYAKWLMADFLKTLDPRWGEFQLLFEEVTGVPKTMEGCLAYNASRAAYFAEEATDNLVFMEEQLLGLLQHVRACRHNLATADKTTVAGARVLRVGQSGLADKLKTFNDWMEHEGDPLHPMQYYMELHGPR